GQVQVSSIDAGTDRQGVNEVYVIVAPFTITTQSGSVTSPGGAFGLSDNGGVQILPGHISSISAGQQGIITYLTSAGDAYWFSGAGGSSTFLASNVKQVATGTDAAGAYLIDLLFNTGTLVE